jgi:hypothetical protein
MEPQCPVSGHGLALYSVSGLIKQHSTGIKKLTPQLYLLPNCAFTGMGLLFVQWRKGLFLCFEC